MYRWSSHQRQRQAAGAHSHPSRDGSWWQWRRLYWHWEHCTWKPRLIFYTLCCIVQNLTVCASTACELPSSTVEAEVKPTKQRIAPFRMKVIRDLRRVQESNEKEEEELPHILTIKEWVKLEKKREKEAKKAMKKESQLVYVTSLAWPQCKLPFLRQKRGLGLRLVSMYITS